MKKKSAKKSGKSAAAKIAASGKGVKPGLLSIRKQLLTMRDEVLKASERKEIVTDVGGSTGDSVDEASQSIERELLFELSDSGRTTLDQIEAALRKIDRGVYGVCESCRKPIAKLRLKTLPFARYCINCQNGAEKSPESRLEPVAELSAAGGEDVSASDS
ncbi:MAG TPA: TraR/DksA family transcriptional regulator [Elusimicrobiota bacterium]|nr:TraR/DksA family transcriptional regulator [Elusimicrobiota bacterium]